MTSRTKYFAVSFDKIVFLEFLTLVIHSKSFVLFFDYKNSQCHCQTMYDLFPIRYWFDIIDGTRPVCGKLIKIIIENIFLKFKSALKFSERLWKSSKQSSDARLNFKFIHY